MSSNYPPGVTGMEPEISGYDEKDGLQEVECGWDPCRYAVEVGTSEVYSHGIVTWVAEWKCPSCTEDNSTEGWYDPNDNS